MKVELFYRLLLHDKNGRLVKDSGLKPACSYVIQFLQFIEGCFRGSDLNATDVDNTSQMIVNYGAQCNYTLPANAGAGIDTYGLVVGTNAGATAESNTNYKLDTKILHSGVGAAGRLNYQAVTFTAAGVVGANVDFSVNRAFVNETGSDIVVREIGIIGRTFDGAAWHYFLLLRDVVPDFTVTAGYTLTVVYTLRTTV